MKDNKITEEKGINVMYLLGFFIAAKIIHYVFKKDLPLKKEEPVLSNSEENKFEEDKLEKVNTDETSFKEIPKKSTKEIPQEISRNSWLYTDDNFGKMEKGRAD
jgi:hypothetical protein